MSDESTQEPLPGVTVLLKGTAHGAVSDLNGEYAIEVDAPASSVLTFSFVGYLTKEIPVGSQTAINVAMAPDVIGLEEVVITGYGTERNTGWFRSRRFRHCLG